MDVLLVRYPLSSWYFPFESISPSLKAMTEHNLPRNNNFDLLRLLFAVTVAVTHLYELSGNMAIKVIPVSLSYLFLSSGRAVQGFFVISGFLIFMSYERSTSLRTYAEKRIRRLYPGYATNILLCAVALCLVSTLAPQAYFHAKDFFRFIFFNLFFLNGHQWTLPGVFETNKFTAVNGALWTLQVEALFYICVPLIVWVLRRVGKIPTLAVLYILSYMYVQYFTSHGDDTTARQFPGQMMFFVGGALLYYFYHLFFRYRYAFLAAAILIEIANHWFPLPALLPLALSVIVVFLASGIPYLGNASRFGDLSYSIYIYHFPVIQTLVLLLPAGDTFRLVTSALLLVPVFGLLSWHLIEKRFLHSSSHYMQSKVQAW